MLKFVTALSAALVVGLISAGSATTASAGGYRGGGYGGGGCCGPIPPKYYSKTVYKHKHIRRVHDVWRHKYIPRIKRIVHVTKIQPIVHVHNLTRVHTKLIGVIKPVYQHYTHVLPARTHVTSRTVYLKPVCGCAYGGGYGGGGGGGYGKY